MATTVYPARKTVYNGIEMRSRLEARVAAWLDRAGFGWQYEPAAFKMQRGGEYLPDFSFGPLPQGLGWGGALSAGELVPGFLEVKPAGIAVPFWQRRMAAVWEQYPQAVLVIAAPAADVIGVDDAGPHQPALVRVGLGPGWESDDPGLFGPTWDTGWFGRCVQCAGVSLLFAPGHWSCHRCGHYEGNATWSDLDDWPYSPEAWRRETGGS